MGYSGYGYGAPHMMAPHHHMGHHGGHGMGHGRGMGGGGGMVPFRAGDWKCGSEGCGYHNFAKNINCLRCGASRAGAAVVADSAFPSPHEPSSGYGMGPPSMGVTPGSGSFAAASGAFGSGGFGSQQYGGPPSQYALPTGLGAPTAAYPPMGAGYNQGGSGHSGGPFDSRAAEVAFASAGNGLPPSNAPNGVSYGGGGYGGMDGSSDPFAFLATGLGGLSMSDDARRNGANPNKSPA